jgi:CSLREA domain-containing protein
LQPLTVNSSADPGDGPCTAAECTLREALTLANSLIGDNTIAFNIPGAGPHVIHLTANLPAVTDRVFINGYTQPGAQPNTNPMTEPINAVILIELDGSRANVGLDFTGNSWNSEVRGLAINGLRSMAISDSRRTVVKGNFLGTDAAGLVALGNGWGVSSGGGIGGTTPIIGGADPADRNLIAGNGTGVSVGALSFATVQGNFIGTDRTGMYALGNGVGVSAYNCVGCELGRLTLTGNLISGNATGATVSYTCCSIGGNLVGTDRTGQGPLPNTGDGLVVSSYELGIGGNTFAYNGRYGVRVVDSGGVNRVRLSSNRIFANGAAGVAVTGGRTAVGITANTIYDNGGLGIDLNADGLTLNDTGDGDSGPNGLQNYPELQLSGSNGQSTVLHGVVNSTPNRPLHLEFFANGQCDPSGYGEGQTFLAGHEVTTDGAGTAFFTLDLPVALPSDQALAATATYVRNSPDAGDATSEFSPCQPVAAVINSDLRASGLTTGYDPTPVPNAPAGRFTLRATFDNRRSTPLRNLFFKVTTLTDNHLLFNAAGGPAGVGAVLAVPGEIPAGGRFTVDFVIGLQTRSAFTFLVDSYGAAAVTGSAVEPAPGFAYTAAETDLQPTTTASEAIYLPLISR